MECKNCGAQISIKDLTCPYCGTQNEEAKEYFKQQEKEKLEKEKELARLEAETKKKKMETDLKESVSGSRRAMKFLTLLLIVCGIVSVISLVVFTVCEAKWDKLYMDPDRTAREGSPAEEYLALKEKYRSSYLDSCFDFHLQVDSYRYILEQGDIPDEYTFRDLARCGQQAYREAHPEHEYDLMDKALMEKEYKYITDFFESEFELTEEECTFLYPEEGYLSSEAADEAGKMLRKRFRQVRL